MRMTDGVYIGAHAIEKQMHGNFGREFAFAGKLAAFEIRDNEILRLEHAFVHRRGSSENAVFVEADGDVAFAGYDEAAVIHPLAGSANVAAVLFFAFFMGGPERVCVHCAHHFLARICARPFSCPPSKKKRPGSEQPETRGALYHTKRKYRVTLERCRRGQSRA